MFCPQQLHELPGLGISALRYAKTNPALLHQLSYTKKPKDPFDFRTSETKLRNNSSRNLLSSQTNAVKEISCMFWDLGFDWAGSLQERDLFQVPIFTMGSFRGLD